MAKDQNKEEELSEKSGEVEIENTSTPEISEVEKLEAKVKELEDKYLRTNAEFDNIRKRMEKEKMMATAYAHEVFARDLLPIIDALEMAKDSSEIEENQNSEELLHKIKEGINLTIEQFRKTFEKHGIELVDMGGEFNPNFHEAVMQIEREGTDSGAILEVFQKGYKIKDRVLRPAMVSIAK